MIENFGLHWRAEKVFWGRPNDSDTLLGARSRSRSARPVDFRYQRGIYALYADYDLVYVDQTGSAQDDRLFKRLKAHRNDHLSERWNRFSWFGTQWVTQQHALSAEAAKIAATVPAALNILEAMAIAISEPRLNLSRGRWGDAVQFFQFTEKDQSEEESSAD